MVKMRVIKAGGISGQKRSVGDVVEVKSSLAPALEQDGRAEFVDERPEAKKRAGTRKASAGSRTRR